jgi:hypothetical protein
MQKTMRVQHQQDDHTQKGATRKSSKTLDNMGQHNSTTIHYNDGALELIGDVGLDPEIKHTINVNIQIM